MDNAVDNGYIMTAGIREPPAGRGPRRAWTSSGSTYLFYAVADLMSRAALDVHGPRAGAGLDRFVAGCICSLLFGPRPRHRVPATARSRLLAGLYAPQPC
ncbi:hypothetical protein GCM10020221_21080 [Streptomyces thioluteus]|uniref:Uncharacterized protein n=1 Tax=Streptomyces thioluteus TaxID=66431 RepID=A0ABN3WR57_STRTU